VTESRDEAAVVEVNREHLAERQNLNREEFAEGQQQNRETFIEG
jgi:hypothetical protein